MYLLLQTLVLKEWCCQRVLHHCWHQRQGFRQTHFRQHRQTQTCVSMKIIQHNDYLPEILNNGKKVIATRSNCSLGISTTKPLNPKPLFKNHAPGFLHPLPPPSRLMALQTCLSESLNPTIHDDFHTRKSIKRDFIVQGGQDVLHSKVQGFQQE